MNSFFALACLVTLAFASATVNYCDLNCKDIGVKHVACNKTNAFAPKCNGRIEGFDMSETLQYRDYILSLHNIYRNEVAGGYDGRYPIATDMLPLEWDNELASFAFNNLQKCTAEKDFCHRSTTFDNPGQNFATIVKRSYSSRFDSLQSVVSSWFTSSQYLKNPTADIASFPAAGKYEYEHKAASFARMVLAKNPRVGCALTERLDIFTCVCNYGFDVQTGDSLYTIGSKAASGCLSSNPLYPNLCSAADTENHIKALKV